jgi:MOSC domain-containing protein YiiM
MSVLLSVNVGSAMPNPHKPVRSTGIAKQPQSAPVELRDPGQRPGASGVAGDFIGDYRVHGGPDQAVYAYAREDLDDWEAQLGRALPNGSFGENLTTGDIDVNGALIGEQWRIGPDAILQVTAPRVPCATFRGWIDTPGWLKTFTQAARPGAYLRVVAPGPVSAGDQIVVVHRLSHQVSVAVVFRALTLEPELLPLLQAAAADLPASLGGEVTGRSTVRR